MKLSQTLKIKDILAKTFLSKLKQGLRILHAEIMIEANEFRLCNLLHDKKNNRIVAFHGLTENHNKVIVNYANGSGIYYLEFDEIEPIKLTEDMLLKCGFELYLESNPYWYRLDNFCISVLGKVEIKQHFNDDYKLPYDVIYLHELQNLYWCLTKQELQVNL